MASKINVNVQSLQIVSSVSHKTFVSFVDNQSSSDAAAVVNVNEEFQLSAVIQNTGKASVQAAVTLTLPAGYAQAPVAMAAAAGASGYSTEYTARESSGQIFTLVVGETPTSWNIVAPAAPDAGPQTITISVEAAGPKQEGSIKGSIDVIAGPSQLVFTTLPFTNIVVGQPSLPITVQTQNAIGQPHNPSNPTTLSLSSSSDSGKFFSDAACKQSINAVSISASANSTSFYYLDTSAGSPTIKASDTSTSSDSLGSTSQQHTISQASTQTVAKCTTVNPQVGQPVTLTATVTAVAPGSGFPTGRVQFSCNSNTSPLAVSQPQPNVTNAVFTPPTSGTYNFIAKYPGDNNFIHSSNEASVAVSPAHARIKGRVLTAGGLKPISGVEVAAQDSKGALISSGCTGHDGCYSLTVNAGEPALVLFPASTPYGTQQLFLKPPGTIYVAQASEDAPLQDISYELRTCQVSGTVQQMIGKSCQPLSGVQVSLLDALQQTTVDATTTDAQGNFCFNPAVPVGGTSFILQLPATVTVGRDILLLPNNSKGSPATHMSVSVMPDVLSPVTVPFIYQPQLATLSGRVTDGENGLSGVTVELSGQPPTTTDQTGVYTFSGLPPGPAQLRFKASATANGTTWELQPGHAGTQSITIVAGQAVQANPVAYRPEQHSLEQQVLMDGKPAENILVDVRPKGAQFAAQAQRTGKDGKVTFVLAYGGDYEVRVYPDPSASGGPQVNYVPVHSHAKGAVVHLAPPAINSGGTAPNGSQAEIDLQAYPVLTEEVPAGVLPATTRAGSAGTVGGTSALGQAADRAIREVLSWRTKSDDSKGFLTALGQAFDLKEVEGHTEWTWTPRSYTVQTDMGAVTGAQASIYTRAKVALDQSMPLLDGLYPLVPNVEAEDLATVQSVVRTQFTALVNEFGTVGGPRVPRVDELFQLLLGHEDPDLPPTKPEEVVKGSLGLVRQRFGFQRRYVITVDDEQNFTNYLILVDYLIGLNHSWIHDKNYFIRNGVAHGFAPFFGTQLVLLSRALDVVAQAVQDAYFAMDSVFMGDAERQVAQLNFSSLGQSSIPNGKGGSELLLFKPGTSGLFVAELLDWVDRAASDELPRLLQDAGKDGLDSLQRVTDRLRKFVHGAISPPQNAVGLPPGYHTPRVKRAMRLLADGLDETYKLALQLRPPDLPVEVSRDELRRLIKDEMNNL